MRAALPLLLLAFSPAPAPSGGTPGSGSAGCQCNVSRAVGQGGGLLLADFVSVAFVNTPTAWLAIGLNGSHPCAAAGLTVAASHHRIADGIACWRECAGGCLTLPTRTMLSTVRAIYFCHANSGVRSQIQQAG